jgi:L-alanine-DL-glutamate epimerase-like enolase superfamily enzyme
MEGVERFGGLYAELARPGFEWRDGYLMPPDRPGLGFELDEVAARRYRPDGAGPPLVRPY